MKDLCVVIPVYNETPERAEMYSLQQLAKKCPGKYDICFVYPDSWSDDITQRYENIIYTNDPKRKMILHASFDDEYFKSTKDYSRLMKSHELYNRFNDYEYILIYQTDCLPINMMKLDDWIKNGFDYVGAPIIANKYHWPSMPCCGNGGLSLRKVSKFLYITNDDKLREKVDKMGKAVAEYEDVYFCEGISQFIYIDMPSWEDCATFAWDMNPDVLDRNHNFKYDMLVGCHAFGKNIPYWFDKLGIPEDIVNECYDKHKEFIDAYYKRTGDMMKWMVPFSNRKYIN